jgi:hypothetical protein
VSEHGAPASDPQRLREVLAEIDRKLAWLDEQGWRVTLRTGRRVNTHRRDYLRAREVVVQELERLEQSR